MRRGLPNSQELAHRLLFLASRALKSNAIASYELIQNWKQFERPHQAYSTQVSRVTGGRLGAGVLDAGKGVKYVQSVNFRLGSSGSYSRDTGAHGRLHAGA